MKKFICIILVAFLICGCSNNIKLTINEPSKILYDDIQIHSSDFAEILKRINEKNFLPLYNFEAVGKNLSFISNELTYNFEILDNYIIYLEKDKKYYTKEENIKKFLDELKNKYDTTDIININLVENYKQYNPDYVIKLDNSQKYIIITTKMNIYDFEVRSNQVSNIQNEISKIENGKIICIEKGDIENLNISFKNPYEKQFTVTYDKEFKIEIKKDA